MCEGQMELKTTDVGLMRAVVDDGCTVYQSQPSKPSLKKLDVIQYQALRLCCGALGTTPVSALQLETNDMPLEIRRKQFTLTNWANCRESHPTQPVLHPRLEKEKEKG